MFCSLVIIIKTFDPMNIRKPWAPEITMFCSEVMMIRIFNPIKSRRPWPTISISYLFQQGVLALGCSFFTPGAFWFRYKNDLKIMNLKREQGLTTALKSKKTRWKSCTCQHYLIYQDSILTLALPLLLFYLSK